MLHIYDGYFSAQTFAYKHVPPYWTAKWTCSQARFTSVANRTINAFAVHWTGRVKITTVPNRTKPNRERSKSRLKETYRGPSICQQLLCIGPLRGCPHWVSKKVQTVPMTAQHDGLLRVVWRTTARARCCCLYWAIILPTCRYTFPIPVVSLAPAGFFSAPYNKNPVGVQKHTKFSERHIDTSAKWGNNTGGLEAQQHNKLTTHYLNGIHMQIICRRCNRQNLKEKLILINNKYWQWYNLSQIPRSCHSKLLHWAKHLKWFAWKCIAKNGLAQ